MLEEKEKKLGIKGRKEGKEKCLSIKKHKFYVLYIDRIYTNNVWMFMLEKIRQK